SMVSSPSANCEERSAGPRRSARYAPSSLRASSISHPRLEKASALDRAGPPDLLLQEQHTVNERFGAWRAARNVDIHGNDAFAYAHHGVGIMIIAAAIGAGAHGDDVAGLRHLIVDLAQGGRHLVAERAGDDHHI